MMLPCVRFPPFSNKLRCYKDCMTEPFKPYTDSIEKYITNGVDLKVLGDKSISEYSDFINFIKERSFIETFTLHISNDMTSDAFVEIGDCLPIDDDFEKLFFEIIEQFNQGQSFTFEFQYKTENISELNVDFLNHLIKYIDDNENIEVDNIIIGESKKQFFVSLSDLKDFTKNLTR